MIRFALSLLALAVVVACALNPPDYGRPCDDKHACPDGYKCFQNACVPPDFPLLADAGVADAGSPDAGP
jgi:hypothetical protein